MPRLDPRQPLWMPKGSVRALIALLLVITAVISGLMALVHGLGAGLIDGPSTVAIVLAVISLSQLVVNAYFLTRNQAPRE